MTPDVESQTGSTESIKKTPEDCKTCEGFAAFALTGLGGYIMTLRKVGKTNVHRALILSAGTSVIAMGVMRLKDLADKHL